MKKKDGTKTRDPMARDLRTPKYRPLAIPNKKKSVKVKHKKRDTDA